eukprot:gnl/TRDRNA2_/TRDRNA2_171136_c0_seq1.p1 gnl/TRDRNA2_/TRDRNA2_171136_c0~~gnl/TRDRNA2_/TRDRNA2_171136_c0_seq1.p1  ORF type:complete len:839 (-),score=180.61 gnl/TRDRNA2_/TRDRNA2_171136_c0_seq1:34-2550(-)
MERQRSASPGSHPVTARGALTGEIRLLHMRAYKSNDITMYMLQLTNGSESWVVSRRYTEFLRCNVQLLEYFKPREMPAFPPKEPLVQAISLIRGEKWKSQWLLERHQKLQRYIIGCLQHPEVSQTRVLREFLNAPDQDFRLSAGEGDSRDPADVDEEGDDGMPALSALSCVRLRLTGKPGEVEIRVRADGDPDSRARQVYLLLQPIDDGDPIDTALSTSGPPKLPVQNTDARVQRHELQVSTEAGPASEVSLVVKLEPGSFWELHVRGVNASGIAGKPICLQLRAPQAAELESLLDAKQKHEAAEAAAAQSDDTITASEAAVSLEVDSEAARQKEVQAAKIALAEAMRSHDVAFLKAAIEVARSAGLDEDADLEAAVSALAKDEERRKAAAVAAAADLRDAMTCSPLDEEHLRIAIEAGEKAGLPLTEIEAAQQLLESSRQRSPDPPEGRDTAVSSCDDAPTARSEATVSRCDASGSASGAGEPVSRPAEVESASPGEETAEVSGEEASQDPEEDWRSHESSGGEESTDPSRPADSSEPSAPQSQHGGYLARAAARKAAAAAEGGQSSPSRARKLKGYPSSAFRGPRPEDFADKGNYERQLAGLEYGEQRKVLAYKGNAAAAYADRVRSSVEASMEKTPHRCEKSADGTLRAVAVKFEMVGAKPAISPTHAEKLATLRSGEALDRGRKENQAQILREEERAACKWIHAVTGHADAAAAGSDEEEMTMQVALRSGEALCDLVNAIWPGRITGILRGQVKPYRRVENISRFLRACSEIGVSAQNTFELVDLVEGKNLSRVVRCIQALAALVPEPPEYEGPRLDAQGRNAAEQAAARWPRS